jgi:hypothetical protein
MDQKSKPTTPAKGQMVPSRPGVPQRTGGAAMSVVERTIRQWLGALIDLADRTANRLFDLPLK